MSELKLITECQISGNEDLHNKQQSKNKATKQQAVSAEFVFEVRCRPQEGLIAEDVIDLTRTVIGRRCPKCCTLENLDFTTGLRARLSASAHPTRRR